MLFGMLLPSAKARGPQKAHIQGVICAWGWILNFASTQLDGSFSPFPDEVMSLGWGLRKPWGACCQLLLDLLNG